MDARSFEFRTLANLLADELETLENDEATCACCGHTRWHRHDCPIPYLHSLKGAVDGQEEFRESSSTVG